MEKIKKKIISEPSYTNHGGLDKVKVYSLNKTI